MNSTPVSWRLGLAAAIVAVTAAAYLTAGTIDVKLQSLCGVVAFFLIAVLFSANLRAINWRVVATGLSLQVVLAVVITKVPFVYRGFEVVGNFVAKVLTFTEGPTATLFGTVWPRPPLALIILPTVIFVACAFTILFHLKVLQGIVWVLAKLMVLLMGKRGVSGAETLSAVANVFMGQTEAPLIVAPYVAKMTKSELLAIMIGGMAAIAGGVMAIYISMGANAVALLATSVMAAPCGLYVAKILQPETETPLTRGTLTIANETGYANVIDAAAAGASEGMKLAINIIAMLIAFTALIVMFNYLLGQVWTGMTLQIVFGEIFAPIAVLMGVDAADVPKVAELLGIKLVGNEFLAFDAMTQQYKPGTANGMTDRSYALTTYALTGFANISSIGILLGGIGSLAKDPADQLALRAKLARLGPKALLGGFLATLMNAAVAGVLL